MPRRRRQGPAVSRKCYYLAAGCGLAAGLLEVGSRILCRSINPTNRLYEMSRHFVWLAPLTYLLLFLAMGLFLAAITWLWPRPGGWLSRRLIVACALLPAFVVASPQIDLVAWMILALGIASRLVPVLERHAIRVAAVAGVEFSRSRGVVLVLAGSVFGGDWLKEWREARRPLPPADSPNVLLIVLDTVRADHLSLYGYRSPHHAQARTAREAGIRFDDARATAPWTRLAREHVHGPLAPRA